jgi:ubiquinone/menaquinone biosynthesis C-methylase UbiE
MDKNETIREQFGANAAAYVNSQTHANGASLARLVALVAPESHWHVLDVATGTGHTALTLAPHVGHVWATDITPEMLKQAADLTAARAIDNMTIEFADAEKLPYVSASFHLVTCRIAAHHFVDIDRFLHEATRVLKPGGTLAVVDNIVPGGAAGAYVNAFEKLRDPSHRRCWSLRQWIDGFEREGLSVVQQETLVKSMAFDFWAQRHDAVMQSYLLAMLSEVRGEAAHFLQPRLQHRGSTFQLVEGIVIGRKPVL